MTRLLWPALAALALTLGLSAAGGGLMAPPPAAPPPAAAAAPATEPGTPSAPDGAPEAARPAPAAALALRWSVPEPHLVAGRMQRRLVHGSADLPVNQAALDAVRLRGTLAPLRAELDTLYARLDARTPRDVRFVRVGGQWVGEARTGWTVDRAASDRAVLRALRAGGSAAPLTVRLTPPPRSVRWAAAQGLGHVGTGTSSFTGSPEFRVHNIRVGAQKMHGRWIGPGAAFDFNALVGRVSAAGGFRPGFVVTGNTLSMEDGGGLCQVSTTVFRAAMTAGVPIQERHGHSYQVGYYGEPGLDAAVYAPSKTLRWRNDFRSPLLIQTGWNVETGRLDVHLFARPDGRRVKIGAPEVSGAVRPPDPTFIADPAMKPGETRRVDMPAPGARVKVVREITRADGTVRRDVTRSAYRAWGGVFAVAPGDERAQ